MDKGKVVVWTAPWLSVLSCPREEPQVTVHLVLITTGRRRRRGRGGLGGGGRRERVEQSIIEYGVDPYPHSAAQDYVTKRNRAEHD